VLDHHLRQVESLGHEPGGIPGNEGRIFHAPGSRIFRIDQRDRLVGIGPIPLLEMLERLPQDALVPLHLSPVRGLHHDLHHHS
jgi:hypothetical protein